MDPLDDVLHRGLRYAMSLTHDRSDAEDLLQDAWISVVRAGGPQTAAYLVRAIRSRWVDGHRRSKIVEMVPLVEPSGIACGDRGHADVAADRQHLDQLLGTLGVDQREALYLNVVEGWTASEIATLTDRPRNTVLSLIHRAKCALRASAVRQEAL